MSIAEEFIPQVLQDGGDRLQSYATVLIELDRCRHCGTFMIDDNRRDPFPKYYEAALDAQRLRAGWGLTAPSGLCASCWNGDAATMTCALCGEQRPSSQVQESIGNPAEYLCMHCYETVPAKEWDAKMADMHKDHRWDYE